MQPVINPCWVPAAVQNSVNLNIFIGCPIIDSERKPLGKQAVMVENLCMNAAEKFEGFNVRKERVEKITPQSGLLHFVEIKTVNQILLGLRQNLNFHDV